MVINDRKAYAAFRESNTDEDFARWGAEAELTRRTQPMVRGTVAMGGGLIPAKNYYLFSR
ncbi:hypothetical protein ACFYW9_19125 [Streptomyces sp. NPDC002698]|uniref:hypothetical protein n=1 Tax=Streptomyces sp. NPDC002698 TaxID=3364660 RepID=UPI0036A94085